MHAHDWRVTRLEMAERRQDAEQVRAAKAARRAKQSAAKKAGRSKTTYRPKKPVIVPTVRRVQHR